MIMTLQVELYLNDLISYNFQPGAKNLSSDCLTLFIGAQNVYAGM